MLLFRFNVFEMTYCKVYLLRRLKTKFFKSRSGEPT